MLKTEVKQLLKESGHGDLFSNAVYEHAKYLTNEQAKKDKNLKQCFNILEGTKAKYIHDLIVRNKDLIRNV